MGGHKKHQYNLEHYTKIYNVSLATIKRYVKKGFPLDNEEETRLLISLQDGGNVAKVDELEEQKAPAKRKKAPRNASSSSSGDLGLSANISRLRQAERNAYEEWECESDELKRAFKQKQWLSFSEQLRKVEDSNPSIQEANKSSISKEELAKVLGVMFRNLRADLEALPRKIATLTSNQTKKEVEETVTKETNRIIDSLFASHFLGDE